MNVLIIGGTGFIGGRVTRVLLEEGHEVTVFHRGQRHGTTPNDASVVRGNRDEPRDLRGVIRAVSPEVIIDMVLFTRQQAQALVSVAERRHPRLVVISSSDVYRNYDGFRGVGSAPPDPVPLREDAPLRSSLYPYRGTGLPVEWADDYEKILVERQVRKSGCPVTVLRLPAVYGPGDSQHRVGAYLERMQEEMVLNMPRGQSTWRWTRGYVVDVARAVALAATHDQAVDKTYNIGEETALREQEWVEAIANAAGWAGDIVFEEEEENREDSAFSYDLFTDTSRIRTELGFREVTPRNGALAATVKWEESQLTER